MLAVGNEIERPGCPGRSQAEVVLVAWIESHQQLGNHPKTRKLAKLLGISLPQAVGHLHFLWWWALDYAPDGMLAKHDFIDIAIGSEWEEDAGLFVAALLRSGFLEDGQDGLAIHDWCQYGGKLNEKRKASRERAAKHREMSGHKNLENSVAADSKNNARTDTNIRAIPDETPSSQDKLEELFGAEMPRTNEARKKRTRTLRDSARTLREEPRTLQKKNDIEKSREEKRREEERRVEKSREQDMLPIGSERHDAMPLALLPASNGSEVVAAGPGSIAPYRMVEVLCEACGMSDGPSDILSKRDLSKQLGVAKRMIADGLGEQDVRGVVGWLLGQAWVNGGVDLGLVESQHGKWVLAGRPSKAKSGREPISERTADAFSRVMAAIDGHPVDVVEVWDGN